MLEEKTKWSLVFVITGYYFITEKNVRFFQLGRFGLGRTVGGIYDMCEFDTSDGSCESDVESVKRTDVASKKMKCTFSRSY